jgi:phosphoheptose isomerase
MRFDRAIEACVNALKQGNKILIAGNGGSAAQASHFTGELVGRFKKKDRRPLPAINLCADPGVLTAIGNDFGFQEIFSRQIQAYGEKGDILIVLSTSGRSQNILNALYEAADLGLITIGLSGLPGFLGTNADIEIRSIQKETDKIQEEHLKFIHALCEGIDEAF